jgi:nucleoside-diphosphate-sugar epimerase
VGTGVDLSINELAQAVAEAVGWRARIPLAEGLVSTVEAFRTQV